jgi:hypothetical protein
MPYGITIYMGHQADSSYLSPHEMSNTYLLELKRLSRFVRESKMECKSVGFENR